MGGAVMLRPSDLLVQYRDRNLNKRGSIPLPDLRLKVQPVHNGVGSWSVTLPAEHRAVPYMRSRGAGIIITNTTTGAILMSGSASKPSKKATQADPKGMTTISGLSDDRLLWDAMSFPDPSNPNISTQTVSHDTFSGDAETVMRHYFDANIGQSAPAARKVGSLREFLRVEAVNKHLGANVDKTIRFDYIGDILKDIATLRDLRFRVVQVGDILELQISAVEDLTKLIRLDVANGTLQEQSVEEAPPKVTRVAVAGQGEGAERQLLMRTNAEAATAETEWGLIIEQFKDQRNTGVLAELEQAGDEILAADGFTKIAVKATPSNDQTMVFMEDFNTGDKVTVVIEGQETNSNITEAAIVVDDTGLHTAVAIGDIRDFDSSSALRQTVSDTVRRVSDLERNAEQGSEIDWSDVANKPPGLVTPGIVTAFAGASAPAGYLMCDGTAVSRTTYAALFAVIGTTYGVGNNSTTFNLPNMKGRVPVGLDATQTEFDARGETGGAKTHTLTTAEMPVHKHGFTYGGPYLGEGVGGGNAVGSFVNWFLGNSAFAAAANMLGIANAGGGGSHNNLQPYITLNYIIKT